MKTEKDQVLFISSYPPRECGIATFTQDLVHSLDRMFGQSLDIRVCALQEDANVKRSYPEEVTEQLDTQDPAQCMALADRINSNERITCVVIEHEFGLFKGHYGDHIFYLLDELQKPVYICMHTVLEGPDEQMQKVVMKLGQRAAKLVVLTEHSRKVLQSDYQVPSSHIEVIGHGVHLVKPVLDRTSLKAKYGFANKTILGTFGLISSNKGIETALEAIAAMPDRSNVLYLVMGKTHPCVFQHEGEKYREFLIEKTRQLGIEENVLFINKYLELKELLTYLKLTDMYLFTSTDPKQTVSGTLSYAMGSGCTVISTPIPYAKEMLQGDSGFTFDFGNSAQLSEIIVQLMNDPKRLKETSINAARKARGFAWENIAIRFGQLFKKHLEAGRLKHAQPPLKLSHFCKLTNANGIVQFSNMCEPDLDSGYTTDDNARALYVLTMYNELYPNDPYIKKYFHIYLNFLDRALQERGNFLNYLDRNGEFTIQNHIENLEEANARAFVSLCRFVQSNEIEPALKAQAFEILSKASRYIYTIRSPRPVAKVIKGLYFLNQYRKDPVHMMQIRSFAAELMRIYQETASAGWEWFEPYLTYNNSAIPEGLMYAYLATNESSYKKTALESFDFLLSQTFTEGRIRPISNNGWIKRDEPYTHRYGEQPMEVASVIEALYIFYQATGEQRFMDNMHTAFAWFLGHNHLGQMVYNPVNGGCHDGIEETEVNINQGAESTLSYIVSRLTMDKLTLHEYCFTDLFAQSENKIDL